ncbi:MAG TPA: signal peptidase I [Clostridiaceae bacterium]|nr:signal peptidase I [Clostridiaceae bacterium]
MNAIKIIIKCLFWGLIIFLLIVSIFRFIYKDPEKAPISLWYVYSESMEPTIMTNDGFILIRSETYKTGDIITFKPKVLEQPYVTHRIIDITSNGEYITKGDNNIMTDQQGGEPPLQNNQVIGKALCIFDRPIILPGLGLMSQKMQKLNIFTLISVMIVIYALGFVLDMIFNRENNRKIKKKKIRLLDIAPFFDPVFFLICVLVITNTLIIGQSIKSWKMEEISYVVVSRKGLPNPVPGEKFERTRSLENSSIIPYYTVLEPIDGNMTIEPRILLMNPKENTDYLVSITAPEELGYYVHKIGIKTYPKLISQKLLEQLYSKNPFVPLIIIFFPGIMLVIVLFIIWVRRWENNKKLVMDCLIPLRIGLKKLV